jgi:hypothetical protein
VFNRPGCEAFAVTEDNRRLIQVHVPHLEVTNADVQQELEQQQQQSKDELPTPTFDHSAIMYGVLRFSGRTAEGYTVGWEASFNDPQSDVPESD